MAKNMNWCVKVFMVAGAALGAAVGGAASKSWWGAAGGAVLGGTAGYVYGRLNCPDVDP